eukprot:COSAG02_NODE_5903_length_3947_cov_3.181133_1_plen_84_part_10
MRDEYNSDSHRAIVTGKSIFRIDLASTAVHYSCTPAVVLLVHRLEAGLCCVLTGQNAKISRWKQRRRPRRRVTGGLSRSTESQA